MSADAGPTTPGPTAAEELAAVLAALRLLAAGGEAAPSTTDPFTAWRHRRQAALGQRPRPFPR